MERTVDASASLLENLQDIVENVIWHLDGRSVLRAKQVCCLWKETIEHLERYNRLWRHICLRDIHRASLIDIVGFNPLSDDCQDDSPCGSDDGEFEDLWKNVYRSWRAGQFLNRCKKSSFKLPGFSYSSGVLLIGAYVYMLTHDKVSLSVWNIDTSEQVLYSQDLRGKVNLSGSRSQMFAHLQNPLCKFSQHQDLTQHSLIILAVGYIQWWIFTNGEFRLANMLPVDYRIVGVWHNTLVTFYKCIMKVFKLERRENECNFHARNVSEKLPDDLDWTSMNVWNNKCLFSVKSEPYSIAIYGLDDFQRQLIVTGLVNIQPASTRNLRLFGDFIFNTIDEVPLSSQKTKLYVFNTETGKQLHVKVNRVYLSKYELHGDLLIANQTLLDKVSLCRINKTGHKDPVWYEYASQRNSIEDEEDIEEDNIGDDDEVRVVVPEVFETKKMIRGLYTIIISYGESIVILKRKTSSDECILDQYVY